MAGNTKHFLKEPDDGDTMISEMGSARSTSPLPHVTTFFINYPMLPGIRIITLLFAASACTYTPDETFFKEVEQKQPTANITLDNVPQGQDIYLDDGATFSLNIQTTVTVSKTEVFIDTKKIAEFNSGAGSFSIGLEDLKTGSYELKIVITTNSGTGSLADKSGTETVQLWKTWPLVIDVDPPPVPVLTQTEQNGFVKLSWTPFTKKTFKSYNFSISSPGHQNITITDPNKTSFIDSAYLVGYRTYSISTSTNRTTSYGNLIEVSSQQEITMALNSADTSIAVSWRKPKFPGNFKDVVIMEGTTERKVVTNANDTTATVKLESALFGAPSTVVARINARYPAATVAFTDTRTFPNPCADGKLAVLQNYIYSNELNTVLGHDGKFLRFYNSAMTVVDSLPQTASIYSNAQAGKYLYQSSAQGFAQLDLVTKQILTFTTPGHLGAPAPAVSLTDNDNQVVSYIQWDFTNPSDPRRLSTVYDISTNTVMNQVNVPFAVDPGLMELSADGKYGIRNREIFSIAGTTVTTTNVFLPGPVYEFHPDNGDELMYLGCPTDIIKTSDLSHIRTIAPPEVGYTRYNYDPATKRILYRKDGSQSVYLVHSDTGHAILAKAVEYNIVSFLDGTLFTIQGYYKKIL